MRIFVTGTGTAIGKTIVSAIVVKALNADYWKPVQAGLDGETDSEWIRRHVSPESTIHPEKYKLRLAASPHIAAREEGRLISVEEIVNDVPDTSASLVIEGAGGLMVPLNEHEFVADLIPRLGAKIILVSRNMLGSINHSLMTAMVCRQKDLDVLGWIFNDTYLHYEDEIVRWSGYPKLASIPHTDSLAADFISEQAQLWPWKKLI